MKMKRIVTFALASILCLALFSPLQAQAASNKSDYFSDSQWEEICDAGYPSNYPSKLDTFFDAYASTVGDFSYPHWNPSVAYYDGFLDYISNVKKITSNENLSNPSILARGLYLEVSNLSDREDSLYAVYDCVTNHAEAYNKDYMEAVKVMDGLNPSKSTYWQSDVMWNPLQDSLGSSYSAMKALAIAYVAGQMKDMENDNNDFVRYSSLSENMFYMNESWGDEKIGDFWFRKDY